MHMSDGFLEIRYLVRGLTRVLYEPLPWWPGCRIEQDEDFDVTVHLVENSVTAETDLQLLIDRSDARVRQLVLAWEFEFDQRLTLRRVNVLHNLLQEGEGAELRAGVALTDYCIATVVRAPAPAQMPQVPLAAERWIRTLAEAGDFPDYPEEQLRRHCLLIEELWGTYSSHFNAADQEKCEEIKRVRDFISHAYCDRSKVVTFISANLSGAIIFGRERPTVRFDRLAQDHRVFVARYEMDSARIARKLVQLAISDLPPAVFPS